MSRYALDTNIITPILKENKKLQNRIYEEAKRGARIVIPAIVYYEIKRGLIDCKATAKLMEFEKHCGTLGIDDIDVATLNKAAIIYATLKQTGRPIDDADILIAASCIVHNYTLVTDNTSHLGRVDGLQFVNWAE